MKKGVILLALLICSVGANAQMRIGISGGIGGGFTTGSQEVFQNVFVGYSGGNLSGKARISLPVSPVVIIGFAHYAFTSGAITSGSAAFAFNDRLNILNAGVGLEFEVFRAPALSPYLAADFGAYSFSGNNNSYTRAGVGVGGGILLSLPALPIAFDIEAKYRFANLIGKESRTIGPVTISENPINYFQVLVLLTFQLL